ncbi:ADP-heptose:LPS heptosyltransferase [Streptomyces sp. V4I2]|nr:ADP-heptose:LPS heptosyltransferase [Streptomyces sp. V4I2]
MKALVARLDSFGDVLLAGPAVRAVAARADSVTMLCGPRGAAAARLLPGVDDILVWDAPWVGLEPAPVGRGEVEQLIDMIDADAALILTSFH